MTDTLIKIAICDDETGFLRSIYERTTKVFEKLGYPCKIYDFSDSRELIAYCRREPVDAILADIDIPGKNGFDAVRELKEQQPDIPVIFVSSHEELAYQSFRYNPYQFVSKSDMDRLDDVLSGLVKRLIRHREINNIIHFASASGVVDINVNEIMYFKGDRNYVAAYGENGKTLFKFREKLKNLYPALSGSGFIYTQKSYIINCRFISRFERKRVMLTDGTEITNTRRSEIVDEAQRLYGRFMREWT